MAPDGRNQSRHCGHLFMRKPSWSCASGVHIFRHRAFTDRRRIDLQHSRDLFPPHCAPYALYALYPMPYNDLKTAPAPAAAPSSPAAAAGMNAAAPEAPPVKDLALKRARRGSASSSASSYAAGFKGVRALDINPIF